MDYLNKLQMVAADIEACKPYNEYFYYGVIIMTLYRLISCFYTPKMVFVTKNISRQWAKTYDNCDNVTCQLNIIFSNILNKSKFV